MALFASVLLFALSSASTASACSPGSLPGWAEALFGNRPIRTNPDCSFDRAGRSLSATGRGDASVDMGNGLVSQAVAFADQACSTDEHLLVADCSTGKAVMILGLPDPQGDGTGTIHSVRLLQESMGALAPRDGVSLTSIAAKVRNSGATINVDLNSFVQGLRRKDRFDPLCGCKVFYPESAGAKK